MKGSCELSTLLSIDLKWNAIICMWWSLEEFDFRDALIVMVILFSRFVCHEM